MRIDLLYQAACRMRAHGDASGEFLILALGDELSLEHQVIHKLAQGQRLSCGLWGTYTNLGSSSMGPSTLPW